MSFFPDITPLQNKFKSTFATTETDQTASFDFAFIADKFKQMHGQLQSHLYEYLNPKNAEFCSKLIYAIPMTLVLSTLSAPQTAVLSVFSGVCLWSCKEEFLSNDSKINLIHSLAIAFFANMVSFATEFSTNLLIKMPINAALLAASLLMANQIEEYTEEEDVQITTDEQVIE